MDHLQTEACNPAPPAPGVSPAPPAADLFLGIDGGGTHMVAFLATTDVGRIANPSYGPQLTAGSLFWNLPGRGESRPSNLHSGGLALSGTLWHKRALARWQSGRLAV
jgi:hypothetical protein